MNLPEGYAARPATPDDVDALVAFVEACERIDFGSADPARGELLYGWGRVGFELARDARVVLASDREIVGYMQVGAYDPSVQVQCWGRVLPDHRGRGVGGALLGWAEAHARGKIAPGASTPLRADRPAPDLAARELLDAHGLVHVRSFWQMERTLAPPVEAGPDPDGIVIRVSIAEADDRALYRVSDESFADHFGYQHYTFEAWQQEFQGFREYDPSLVFLAEDGPEPVGMSLSIIDEGLGWVAELGVREAWRGRGIGRALLLRSFAELSRRGVEIVRLGVDAANSTGATRLYERAGMTVRREWDVHEKAISRD